MSIPGVTSMWGNLQIKATKDSGNAAAIDVDKGGMIKVTLNGQSELFAASSLGNVTYHGGSGGGDTFANNTALVLLAYGESGGNTFTGGTAWNYVYFTGDGNVYNTSAGSFTDVFNGGGHNTINNPSGAKVQSYP